jgi:GTP-binding protein EngB required for normal cell division
MRPTEPEEQHARLNEHQQRHLLVSCQHVDKLLGEIEHIVAASSSRSVFPRYQSSLTVVQKKVVEDYVARLRARLLSVLRSQGIRPTPPHTDDVFAIRTTLMFADVAIDELRPKYMRGYGALPEAAIPQVDGIVDELRTIVQKLSEYLAEDPARDLQARLARLEQGRDEVETLKALERIITERGLVEYRSTLSMLIERVASRTFEIALFGRVNSGKSSLLNHVLEAAVLPVGINPVTAVPTRITYGPEPRLQVSFADRPASTLPLDRLPEFVTEQQNPGNTRHVLRIVVELPARRLREGVVFVDTPGLGSLARGGAEQTLAYLPRCDMGAVLVDAGSTLTPDDLLTIQALYEAAVPATVLLSKADLLNENDRSSAARYISDQLRQELNLDVCVHPVSVIGEQAVLLDRWFSTEIEPLCAQHEVAARTSIRRKIAALREAVQASLRVRLDRGASVTRLDPTTVAAAERDLRAASGLFADAFPRCERMSTALAALAPDVLRRAAERLRPHGASVQQDGQRVAAEVHASLRDIVGPHVELIRSEVAALAATTAQVAARVAGVLGVPSEERRPELDDVPQLAFAVNGVTIPRASWVAFSGLLLEWHIERHLRRQLAARLDDALAAHGRLMGGWARRAIDEIRREFEQEAEPLRAQFERLHPHETPHAAGEPDETASLERDLEELDQLAAPALEK